MAQGLESLAAMDYPGRVIILGCGHKGRPFVSYAITGRRPSSQARRMVEDQEFKLHIDVTPTDAALISSQGDPNLLIYCAIAANRERIVVSNGRQTNDFGNALDNDLDPIARLHQNLSSWIYEPDSPNFTPRITGIVTASGSAALSIIKKEGDLTTPVRHYFGFVCVPGEGKFISTYTGENKNPLPSFKGEPIDFSFPNISLSEFTEAVYEVLGPNQRRSEDFRVSVATMGFDQNGTPVFYIKNRHGG